MLVKVRIVALRLGNFKEMLLKKVYNIADRFWSVSYANNG